ncbi:MULTISPECIES: thioredoxin family protein [unclassified Alistipes]|mgnify:FL=1|jgi:thioredoxin 1|uniref:thioredoxin family protein n=1 Tax=unclassified Alistipes TaxID=2608932 RepID=UPI000B3ACD7B|nr:MULTISPECIES: thioredoxin family protein [unclassified Alistipes]OUO18792.1 thiol:disulfide interchange protein [Alistipes sp. An31A]HIV32756.1 thioredoxin family protein [Candidatus Alistipes excrementigallinarum]
MKRILLLFLLLLGAVGAEAQVRFMTRSTDGVRRQAVEQNKLVFIDLFATWCPPCQMMEREVFSRSDVGAFMEQHFVCAKYDIDKTTGRELLKRYGNRRVPLYLIFNTEGELLGRIRGATDPERFMAEVKRILDTLPAEPEQQ